MGRARILAGFSSAIGVTTSLNVGIITTGTLKVDGTSITGVAQTSDVRTSSLVVAGVSTFSGQTNLTNTNVTAGIVTVAGQSTLANVNVATGIATVAGQSNFANVNVSAAFTGTTIKGTTFIGDGSGLSGVGGENDITSCLFI